ncbi:hypothetical protein HX870_20830 [Pseudomonas gingeri]|uniref:hypothetical protein n=1 Tax=Pseudomonas gingeri TaxID=117681 RepID=UPI0015A16325|nr:hypothetical protein [Pseudomonas gingeri]NWA27974.1 hypothetical protein [Pseudomonas gingeri]NWD70047.1 hypothetical protein [Pseudomonas gingeri]
MFDPLVRNLLICGDHDGVITSRKERPMRHAASTFYHAEISTTWCIKHLKRKALRADIQCPVVTKLKKVALRTISHSPTQMVYQFK